MDHVSLSHQYLWQQAHTIAAGIFGLKKEEFSFYIYANIIWNDLNMRGYEEDEIT